MSDKESLVGKESPEPVSVLNSETAQPAQRVNTTKARRANVNGKDSQNMNVFIYLF